MAFRAADSEIRNPDGSIVFGMKGIDVPAEWSAVAADVLAQKYFRRAGVPARLAKVAEHDVPQWLWRSIPDEAALAELPQAERFGSEKSARQVFERMAGAWTYWGWKGGYFDSEDDARAFFDEHCFMLAAQICAPNSPQWFNTGLHWAYGIDGPGQGHWFVDHRNGEAHPSSSAYERPQPHACFIQSVDDDLVGEGGIMDLWVREARLFKYGSGTGSNFSRLRGEGERLSGGGKSSGLMSFLKIGDRAAGAIKSGGTTRRAAKMVSVDIDHPDIEQFIAWKMLEEQKVAALVAGSQLANRHLNAVMQACLDGDGEAAFDPRKNPTLRRAIVAARQAALPENYIQRVIQFARQGYRHIEFPAFDTDWESEAYLSVSGQNANNSVRVSDAFLRAVEQDREWALTERTTGKTAKTVNARALWDSVAEAAWHSADPGVQYDTTINDWHTCPQSGRINASNPCSEYMFLDDTACNLASLNLMRFRQADGTIDVAAFEHATRLWTVVLEISVMMAQYPSRTIAELSYRYRTLGLGYANLGALLMSTGLGYDSAGGRAIAGAVTAAHDRHGLRHLGRDGRMDGCLPGLRRQSRRHAAGHPQPSPRRPQRDGRLRKPGDPSAAARLRQLPRRPPRRGGKKGLGQGFGAGRAAWLPQRPGLGHRPHRHDRPGDGLRHHRHRARLRPGEVQEAGRRRLLQDHQPHRPAGARDAGLRPGGHRAHRRPRRRPWLARRSARDQSRDAWRHAASTLAPSSVWKSRSRPPSTSASPSRATPWAKPSAATCWVSTTKRSPIPSSTCCRASDSPRATSPRRTFMRAGR